MCDTLEKKDCLVNLVSRQVNDHDARLIEELLKKKGFKMAIKNSKIYAHPLIMALDWAITKSNHVTENEFVKLNWKLDRPITMWREWDVNVYQHYKDLNHVMSISCLL